MKHILVLIGCLCCVHRCLADDSTTRNFTEQRIADQLVVVPISEASISSSVEGPIVHVSVTEGQDVTAGQVVAQLDDREAKLAKTLAEIQRDIAQEQVSKSAAVKVAIAKQEEQTQLLAEQTVRSEIQSKQAENRLKVQAAEKALDLARNQWQRAQQARQKFSDSVSQAEIDALRLDLQRSELELSQAKFESEIEQLKVQLDAEVSRTLTRQVDTAKAMRAQAESLAEIDRLKATIKQHEFELASLAVSQHQCNTPIDGVVVQLHHQAGDWVQPGQEIARVVNLSRLRADGYLSPTTLADLNPAVLKNLDRKQWAVVIELSSGHVERRKVLHIHISPEIDPITGERRVFAEFDNDSRIISPGMRASLYRRTEPDDSP